MDGPAHRDADELLDIVDDEDCVVGHAPRGEATVRRLCHRAVAVRVRDGQGRQFVHRRTAAKLLFPSRYDMFVGGVVGAGESYDAVPAPTPLFTFRYESPEHLWWLRVYEVRCDQPVAPQPEEVAWHAFLTDEELERRLDEWEWVPEGLEAHHRAAGHPYPPQ
ncbi:NUDIX hydrolase [Streptomyces meridianus]|uniref:NUDIX hydrolase n=1 Tax=Streptomyces meridianus TaxID=2938945 RepID=A0ABT0X7E2_9ACTN|nr:NUDIX hydrolase [Streptomyces meridianus]MCM2578225.1 NUDIX hydrolase [Streptomyces meridianus]